MQVVIFAEREACHFFDERMEPSGIEQYPDAWSPTHWATDCFTRARQAADQLMVRSKRKGRAA